MRDSTVVVLVIAVVLITVPVFWAVYWFIFRMNNRAGMDLGMTGSGFPGAMSDEERHERASRGMEKQQRYERALRRRWPIPLVCVLAGVVILVLTL